jgi:hypothetical protein
MTFDAADQTTLADRIISEPLNIANAMSKLQMQSRTASDSNPKAMG